MKYLYLSTKKIDRYCTPESQTIHDFMFNKKRIFCTKLETPEHNTLKFEFILMTYNINTLLVHISHQEIETFLQWKTRYFPAGIRCIVNIHSTPDVDESLYQLRADSDLTITTHFFEKFVPVLLSITS